jgi:methyl-accepting chemotaxis protein
MMVKKLENDPHNADALNYLLDNNLQLLTKMNSAVKMFERDSKAKLDKIKFFTILISVLVILTISFIFYFAKKKIIKPIETLKEATKEIIAGNLDIELECNNKNEFDDLGSAFQELAHSIKEYREKLKNEKKSIERKVEEAVKKSEEEKAYLSDSVDRIVGVMERVAEGDLTVSVDIRENDGENIKRLFESFNFVIEGFKKILLSVTEAVQATASASTEISSSAEEMAAGAQEMKLFFRRVCVLV